VSKKDAVAKGVFLGYFSKVGALSSAPTFRESRGADPPPSGGGSAW